MGQISTRAHGILDYGIALAFLFIPRILRFDSHLVTLLGLLALITIIYSLMTRYEWGIMPVFPTRIHLITDCLIGIGLCLWPFLAGATFLERNVLIAFGVFEIILALMTPSRSPLERLHLRKRRKSHSLAL